MLERVLHEGVIPALAADVPVRWEYLAEELVSMLDRAGGRINERPKRGEQRS